MNLRSVLLFAGAVLLPVLGLGQTLQRPPVPAVPPQPPAGAAQPPQGQGVLQAPAGLPQASSRPQSYEDWLKWYYQIYSIPTKNVIHVGGRRVRPNSMINTVVEIVGEKGDDYLVRNLSPEDPEAAGHVTWLMNERSELSRRAKIDYLQDKYLIVNNPNVPPPFTDKVSFVRADEGLPKGGRRQISFDIADMNGDGVPDLVFGPARTAEKLVPQIFFQQKDGSWGEAAAKWPTQGIKLDYGTVRVADFDGDGNQDIAIACHFSKTYVLYGNGKGDFTRFVTIPQTNPTMTARALAVGDLNGDGRPDIASYAEIDVNMSNATRITSGLVNIALNLPSGWKAVGEKSFPEYLMGDRLTIADIDMDGKPDLLLTSHASNVMDLLFRNLGGGESWQPFASRQQPVYAYVLANATGQLDRFKQPDLLECFEQHNPWQSEPPTQACVIDRFHDANGTPTLTPIPTVLFQEKSEDTNYKAAAIGDIDGDGRDDIVVVSNTGRVRVFFQGADGAFYEQQHPGMDQPGTDIFDVRIADLYHDGKGEIVFAGAPLGSEGGGVWVYRPVKPGTAPKAAKKP